MVGGSVYLVQFMSRKYKYEYYVAKVILGGCLFSFVKVSIEVEGGNSYSYSMAFLCIAPLTNKSALHELSKD